MDYGKYKYESQKKANQAKKKQKTIDIKEIKLRPNIDVHDYQVKMRSVQKFLNEGDKVGRVLGKFAPLPVSQAQDNTLQKLVGRCVLAGNEPFYAPGSGRPCVYYHVTVHEERRRVTRRQNAEGEWREACGRAMGGR